MDFEKKQNEEKQESPAEKAKRLIEEKKSRETEKELRKTEEKQELIDNKNNLENKISDIDSQIEILKNEAHETRDSMKEAGLEKDDDFKGEYNNIISDLANKLNTLRIKKNELSQKLKETTLDLEKYDKSLDELKKEDQEKSAEKIDNLKKGINEGDVFEKDKETINKLIDDIFENVESKLKQLEAEVNSFDKEKSDPYHILYNQLDSARLGLSPLNKKNESRSASIVYNALDDFSDKAHYNNKYQDYLDLEDSTADRYNKIHQKALKLQIELRKKAGV
ncbi:MAG: hypothetical protein WC928_01845 [Patescibacteria group bacterium]|jgi:hypothetical protein